MTIENAEVMIVSQLETKTSFARRLDNGEEVFIPAHLSIKHDFEVANEFKAVLVPNTRSESVPWLMLKKHGAEKVYPSLEALIESQKVEQVEDVPPLDERIYEFVNNGGYVSTGEVAEAFTAEGEPYDLVCIKLQQMHEAGKLSCAQVFRTALQKKASYRMWATHTQRFLQVHVDDIPDHM